MDVRARVAILGGLVACRANGFDPPAPSTHVDPKTSASAWKAGDPIPGWEDGECEVPTGSSVVTTRFPDLWASGFYLRRPLGGADGWDFTFVLYLTDCEPGDGCVETGPPATYYVNTVGLDVFAPRRTRAQETFYSEQGWGLPAAERESSDGILYVGGWFIDDYDNYTTDGTSVCFSRVRPDEVRGVWYLRLSDGRLPANGVRDYAQGYAVVPFAIEFAERSAYDAACDPGLTERPDTRLSTIFSYVSLSYDDAWPWAQITDPALRAEIHDRYLPFNCP